MKIAVLDNYDSFTYNLVHLFEQIEDCSVTVYRNDQIEKEELEDFDMIVLSPGPGIPDEAGILKEVISHYASKKPIFGVCLGLQAIVEVFGGSIQNLTEVFHGVSTPMYAEVDDALLFQGVENGFEAARYHSWIAAEDNFPDTLEITAKDGQGQIMAIRHKDLPIHAVQFHPESILTPSGKTQLENLVRFYEKHSK
jgi:anthranilate synthase component 2